jgi:hypothetical protein
VSGTFAGSARTLGKSSVLLGRGRRHLISEETNLDACGEQA